MSRLSELEGLLVVQRIRPALEIAAALSSIQSRSRSTPGRARRRDRLAGQLLAQQQGQRGLHRHFIGAVAARVIGSPAVRTSVAASRLPRMPV
jgi:hypothetical protein